MKTIVALILSIVLIGCIPAFAEKQTEIISETPRTSFMEVYKESDHAADCFGCSVAFVYRQHGVSAYSTGEYNNTSLKQALNACLTDWHSESIPMDLVKSFDTWSFNDYMTEKYGTSRYGVIIVYWSDYDCSHAINFYIDNNGRVNLYDCQTGKITNIGFYQNRITNMRVIDCTDCGINLTTSTDYINIGGDIDVEHVS